MLGGIFNKRKKSRDLRSPSLQDVKKFRDTYVKLAELRQVDVPPCLEKSINKAIAGQKDFHIIELRQEEITDQQVIVLAETILEMPIVSTLDVRENRITDNVRFQAILYTKSTFDFINNRAIVFEQGAKALLEVLRLQIIAAKSLPSPDSQTKELLCTLMPTYTRFVVNVNLGGNEVSASVLQEFTHYLNLLRREDKRLEIRVALNRVGRGKFGEEECKKVLKLLSASVPTNKDIRTYMQLSSDITQNQVDLESVLLAKYQASPSKQSLSPPWEALVQERHATLGASSTASTSLPTLFESSDFSVFKDLSSKSSLSLLNCDPDMCSGRSSDVLSLSSRTDQVASVASMNTMTIESDLPTAPIPSTSFDYQSGGDNDLRRSVQSTILNVDDMFQEPKISISAASSPRDSDIADYAPPAFGGNPTRSDSDNHIVVKYDEDLISKNGGISLMKQKQDQLYMRDFDDNNDLFGPNYHYFECDTSNKKISKECPSLLSEHSAGSESIARTSRNDNLEVLEYRKFEDSGQTVPFCSSNICVLNDAEDNKDCIDSLVVDVLKDGKDCTVVKLTHPEFKNGMTVKKFPAELPFRNLLALLLPGNSLTNLQLFDEVSLFVFCRFPFVTVLDLSQNKLKKLQGDGLIAFPRLEVLNLERNQLKTISGLTRTFKLRALSLSHNLIRTLRNIEHLIQLEILNLSHNVISTVHALRILSLNKMLVHLNLDGNSVVETDERRKRRNVVHVRNLLPSLQSMGSISLAHTKTIKTAGNTSEPSYNIFDNDLMPEYRNNWVTCACSTLLVLQHCQPRSLVQKPSNDAEWKSRNVNGEEERHKLIFSRDQQRQNDEMRSRALDYRSRKKVISSPLMLVKSLDQPLISSAKKLNGHRPANPSLVRKQQRRAKELSAPKHTPVNKNLLLEVQNRRTRVDFHGVLSVGERLQLEQEMTYGRATATVTVSERSRSILAKAERNRFCTNIAFESDMKDELTRSEGSLLTMSRPPTPQSSSPLNKALVFCTKKTYMPRSPGRDLTFVDVPPDSPKTNQPTKAAFLRDLAVSDFLGHAKEEFSTALTALNVLLSISEKEHEDRKKVAEYRASLDALDILNEHESLRLYNLAQSHSNAELQAQCIEWFTKLKAVKKCMRQLLEKLDCHAPGSEAIRSYCQILRLDQLRGAQNQIVKAEAEEQSEIGNKPLENGINVLKVETIKPGPSAIVPRPVSYTSLCFPDMKTHTGDYNFEEIPSDDHIANITTKVDLHFSNPNISTPEGIEKAEDEVAETIRQPIDNIEGELTKTQALNSNTVCESINTQTNFSTDKSKDPDDMNWNVSGLCANNFDGFAEKVSAYENDNALNAKAINVDEGEINGQKVEGSITEFSASTTDAITQNEYDWLVTPSDLDIEIDKTDLFPREMNAEFENVIDKGFSQEEWSKGQNNSYSDFEDSNIYDGETASLDENGVPFTRQEGRFDNFVACGGNSKVVAEKINTGEGSLELEEDTIIDDEESQIFGDWEKGFDANSNHHYWFNHYTGESTWIPPEGWPYALFCSAYEAGSEMQQQEIECENEIVIYEDGEVGGQANDKSATDVQDCEDVGCHQSSMQEKFAVDA
ncbi:putative WW domain, leucine-rich repeat domain superfamily, WW domain superfamily [Plasmopara halstedii]